MTAEAQTGVDSRAERGRAIEMKTLSLVSQFEDGNFPFKVGRAGDEFPGIVVGAHMRIAEISVVDGFYILTPKGLMLHAAGFEFVNSAFLAFPTRAALRHASREEYADFEEKIKPVN